MDLKLPKSLMVRSESEADDDDALIELALERIRRAYEKGKLNEGTGRLSTFEMVDCSMRERCEVRLEDMAEQGKQGGTQSGMQIGGCLLHNSLCTIKFKV